MTKNEITPNHYDVLGLSIPHEKSQKLSQNHIKTAYRRALLRHHPDKSSGLNIGTQPALKHTVDQMQLAYKILYDPKSRAEYDQSQRLALSSREHLDGAKSHPGLEIVDLDDLGFDEGESTWYHACRCGNERGFVITEQELEDNVEIGEIISGCRGCSLCLRVMFVVDDG